MRLFLCANLHRNYGGLRALVVFKGHAELSDMWCIFLVILGIRDQVMSLGLERSKAIVGHLLRGVVEDGGIAVGPSDKVISLYSKLRDL